MSEKQNRKPGYYNPTSDDVYPFTGALHRTSYLPLRGGDAPGVCPVGIR